MGLFVTEEDVRQVLMADGKWHEVQPGTWRDYRSHRQFSFKNLDGTETRGQREAVLATRLLDEPASV